MAACMLRTRACTVEEFDFVSKHLSTASWKGAASDIGSLRVEAAMLPPQLKQNKKLRKATGFNSDAF